MKKLLGVVLGALALVLTITAVNTLSAGTFTYEFVANKLPYNPRRPKYYPPVQYPSGYFVVTEDAVRSGTVLPADVVGLQFHYPVAGYGYSSFDGGALTVNPATGLIAGGGLHSTCEWSTYGHGATFTYAGVVQDNPLAGNALGYWRVTYQP